MDGLLGASKGVTALPRHLRGFTQTHLALRRDSRRLAAAAPLLTSAGLPRAAERWRQLRAIVDWHHRAEDEILWPRLIEHVPEIAAGSHRMVQDHVALGDSAFRVTKALKGGRADLIGGPVDTFDTVLHRHLHEEEKLTFPAFARVRPTCSPPLSAASSRRRPSASSGSCRHGCWTDSRSWTG